MRKPKKTIDLKQMLILISSLLMIPGVLLTLIQINVKMSFFGMSMDKTVTTTYWQNGEGDGKYILIIAFLSVLILFFQNYKFVWVSVVAYFAVLIYSLVDLLSQGMKMKDDSAMAEMVKNINPDMSILPREGAILILLSLLILILSGILKNRIIFNFEKKQGLISQTELPTKPNEDENEKI